MRHTPGVDNVVADTLSRPLSSQPLPCSLPGAARLVEDLPPTVEMSPPSVVDWPASSVADWSAASVADWSAASVDDCAVPVSAAVAVGIGPAGPAEPVDWTAFAAAQKTCPSVKEMRDSGSLQIVYRLVGSDYLFGDVSIAVFRPLVPVVFRRLIFDSVHAVCHPGIRASKRLMCSRFVWPCMAKQVTAWARQCVYCQRGKVHRHVHVSPQPIPVPIAASPTVT